MKIITYKKILGVLLMLLYISSLFFGGIMSGYQDVSAQGACTVTDFYFSDYGDKSDTWYKDDESQQTTITIETENCSGEDIEVSMKEGQLTPYTNIDGLDEKIFTVPEEEKLTIVLQLGEDECNAIATIDDCYYHLEIKAGSNTYVSDKATAKQRLAYECVDFCMTNTYILNHNGSFGGECGIKNAYFSNKHGDQDTDDKVNARNGDKFYSDDKQPQIIIDINTIDCYNKDINFSLWERDFGEVAFFTAYFDQGDNTVIGLSEKKLTVPQEERVRLYLSAGENECETFATGIDFRRCRYYVSIETPNGKKFNSWYEHPQGSLLYNCDVTCDENWKLTRDTSQGSSINVQGTAPEYEKGEACVNEEGTGLRPNCYAVLAPLSPDLLEVETGVDGDFTLGKYINIIVNIVIGVAGLLAVVMIIFGGVQYMTTDAIAGKSEAKGTITNAIIGLLIALGSFVILNTINPQLLKIDPDVQSVSLQVQSDAALWLETESDDISNYGLVGTFETPTTSPGVDDFVQSLENNSSVKLARIVVNTPGVGAGTKGTATFIATNGEKVTVDVGLGKNGVVQNADAEQGDGKTPIIKTTINSDIRPPGGPQKNTPATSTTLDTTVNMGAMYAMMNITVNTAKGRVLRGIGFHGHRTSNSLGVTNGCIRMKNDDLVALGKYMKAGTNVWIE